MARSNKSEAKAEQSIDQQKNALYGKATTALRDAHREEFQTILAGLYAEAGLEYKRRLTGAEKARAEIEKLIAAHPDLGLSITETQPGLPGDGSSV